MIVLGILIFHTACEHSKPEVSTQLDMLDESARSLEGLDLYGSHRITINMIQGSHGPLLEACIDDYLNDHLDSYEVHRSELSNALKKHYGLAFAEFTVIKYFNLHNIPGRKAFATIDVVERADAERRMSFTPRPSKHYPDPDGLLKAWQNYMSIGWDLLNRGEISGLRVECPAFHCIFGHKHPQLSSFEDIFVMGVLKNKDKLVRIFLEDHRDQSRADAAFLLAYMLDGNELIQILTQRMNDESDVVRNNVIRVFADIAQFHGNLVLPVKDLMPMLDYPNTTDRNKTLAALFGIVSNKSQLNKYRHVVMAEAMPIILKLLRLKQPNNHDIAYVDLTHYFWSGLW